MTRRYWPAALAILALLVFGSYIGASVFLARQIREDARIYTSMFEAVQRGLTLGDEEQVAALVELQKLIVKLKVPLVVYEPGGRLSAASNLPFKADLTDSADQHRVTMYAGALARRNEPIISSVVGVVYYGSPPILRWLQWLPWMVAAAGFALVLTAVVIVRSNVRAERERMWAAMARELAHQMGTPLSSLTGWVEVLELPADERAGLVDDDKIGKQIGADVERLERVSRRFELIGKPPALERITVSELLRDLDVYFRPRLPRLAGGITLKVRTRAGLPGINANKVLLVWALENIVKNAIDALAGRGGLILISALPGDRGDSVHIRITDDGPGIAPEVRGRIFDPGVTTKSSGWGVGLSLTRRIVEGLHGGRISVRARKRGGTIFDIELPIAGSRIYRGIFRRR